MSKKKPLILVTNDDGIFAKGILSLVEVAVKFGDVVVVAPDSAQSGMGHAVTINDILSISEVSYPVKGVKAFSTTGTPVDCVKLAIYEILNGVKPDFVFSGINHGSNSSINVIYSGTMSAAVEGAVEYIPSVGFSLLNHDADADFSASKRIAERVMAGVIKSGLPKGICLNVNIPDLKYAQIKGIKVCRQGQGFWEDAFEKRTNPHGRDYYWITGEFNNQDKGEDTDTWALNNGFVSIVPTQFDLTAHHVMSDITRIEF